MSRKIGNAQSCATFFRHSAVLSLPAVLLRKLPTNRVKPYLDPALRPIGDDPSKLYLDELDIPADSLEVSESISHDNNFIM